MWNCSLRFIILLHNSIQLRSISEDEIIFKDKQIIYANHTKAYRKTVL